MEIKVVLVFAAEKLLFLRLSDHIHMLTVILASYDQEERGKKKLLRDSLIFMTEYFEC